MTAQIDILIVGAGPTGLTMATLLARYGIDFRIIDKNDGPAVESRALGVQARTLELWHKLGIANDAIAHGMKLNDLYFLNRKSIQKRGKPFFSLGRDGADLTPYPFLLIYEQYKTEQMLVDDLATVAPINRVERNTEIVRLQHDNDGATVDLNQNGHVETVRCRYLVGCDGASSFVRRTVGFKFDGSTYEESLFVADVDLDWQLDDDKFYVETPRHGMLAFFPMRGHGYGDTHYRMLGRLPFGKEDAKTLTQADLQDLLDNHSVVDATIKNVRWVSVYRIHRRMADTFQKGRVFLVGDAAHIHSPAGGQGMNTGIQDAWNLAWKLAYVVRGDADARLLQSYSEERIPVAKTILNGSDRGFSVVASPKLGLHLTRQWLIPLLSTFAASRKTIGRNIFKMVSQVWIGYRGSGAVGQPTASKIKAGDRAPHAILNDGTSVLDLLSGVDHHLLLFPAGAAPSPHINLRLDGFRLAVNTHIIDSSELVVRERYDVSTPTMLLIRPDGHVAWRGSLEDVDGLVRFIGRFYKQIDKETELVMG